MSEADELVDRAIGLLEEAWMILQREEPEGHAYSKLRLISQDLMGWENEREGQSQL